MPSGKVFTDQPAHCMLLCSTIFLHLRYYGSVGSSLERPLHQEFFEQAMTGVEEDVIAQQILLKVKHAHTTLFSLTVGYSLMQNHLYHIMNTVANVHAYIPTIQFIAY